MNLKTSIDWLSSVSSSDRLSSEDIYNQSKFRKPVISWERGKKEVEKGSVGKITGFNVPK